MRLGIRSHTVQVAAALASGALSSVEERPFRIREVEGSNPSVSMFVVCFMPPSGTVTRELD